MTTNTNTPAQTIQNISNELQNLRPETQAAIIKQVSQRLSDLIQGEQEDAKEAANIMHEALVAIEDTEEEKQEAEKKMEKLQEDKEELEAKQELADIMADIMDKMDEARSAADDAQNRAYILEEDEDGIGEKIGELIEQIKDIYNTAEEAAEDHSDEIQELEDQIEDLEEEVNDAETAMDKWSYKQEAAEADKDSHDRMAEFYQEVLDYINDNNWTALNDWAETAEAEVVSPNQEYPEQINTVLYELSESMEEAMEDNPDETPAEAEASLATIAAAQARQAQAQAAAEDEYMDKHHDLAHWVLTEWDGSITANVTLASKKTEVNLWMTAAYESIEEAKKQANEYLTLTTYSGEQAGAAKFLQEVE